MLFYAFGSRHMKCVAVRDGIVLEKELEKKIDSFLIKKS